MTADLVAVRMSKAKYKPLRFVPFSVQMLTERDSVVRESSILLASAAADKQLMGALQQIEALSRQLADDKRTYEEKVPESKAETKQERKTYEYRFHEEFKSRPTEINVSLTTMLFAVFHG